MPSDIDKMRLTRDQDRRARFSETEVREMRELYAKGWTQKAIAERYKAHRVTVCYIVNEDAHRHYLEHRKVYPTKNRTREEARIYMRELRRYKKSLLRGWE